MPKAEEVILPAKAEKKKTPNVLLFLSDRKDTIIINDIR